MKRKVITMIGIAAVMGAASIFAADMWLKSRANAVQQVQVPQDTEPKVEFNTIVVAKVPLRFGMELAQDQLTEIPWPTDALPEGAFQKVDQVLEKGSRVILSPVEMNEPLLISKLSGPGGRATLSNLLTPGMRAVTISVDEIAGVGGFIIPGDHVDIVLTRDAGNIQETSEVATGAAGSTVTTEVVLENVKVLTVDQGADQRDTGPKVANSVTVEVTSDGANKIALARTIGSLSLSLRSAVDDSIKTSGLTTVGSFGGNTPAGIIEAASNLFTPKEAEEKKKFTTVIVTRRLEAESYSVPVPQEEEE
ncbi:MAG: Flp pilus assembly protein CpaB [Rhizobiaceae bacterium]